jgi:cystathionine beta-lyase
MSEFDQVIDRRTTSSAKWGRYADRDILPFWVADMDFRSPAFIRAALSARVEHGIFGYTETPAALVEAAIEWLDERFGWRVQPDWLVWISGVVPGFNMACRAVGARGDAVMMNVPVYYPFLSAPRHGERESIEVPLVRGQGAWFMDFDDMAKAVTARTRLFLLCNPQNPTGRVYTRDELLALARFCERHDLLICSDEIHCSLILDADRNHTPIASLSQEIASRTITLMAPTKTYNTPGLGCAFAIIPDRALRQRFNAARLGLVPGIGPLAYVAATEAYRDRSDWLPSLLGYLAGNRDLLQQTVASIPNVTMTHVEGTYLGWLDIRALNLASIPDHFEAHGLGISDGAQFHGPGFIRFNFACPRPTLTVGLARLREALARA